MKITIIGAGNMGGAMACGLADSQEHEVTVTNISYGKLEKLKEKCQDNKKGSGAFQSGRDMLL